MHVVWVLIAMKLVSGLNEGNPVYVNPMTGSTYVGVGSLPHFQLVQVATFAEQADC